jgi:hypothetical protein
MLLRGTTPLKLFGRPQLVRLTVPIVTSPDVAPSGSQTGLGDVNLFDTFLFKAYYIPLGLGVGKVWAAPKRTVNVFVEPQWTVAHKGDGTEVPAIRLAQLPVPAPSGRALAEGLGPADSEQRRVQVLDIDAPLRDRECIRRSGNPLANVGVRLVRVERRVEVGGKHGVLLDVHVALFPPQCPHGVRGVASAAIRGHERRG